MGRNVGSSSLICKDDRVVGSSVGISVVTSKVGAEVGRAVGLLLRRVGLDVGPSSTGFRVRFVGLLVGVNVLPASTDRS